MKVIFEERLIAALKRRSSTGEIGASFAGSPTKRRNRTFLYGGKI